jgi:hypothetical protein
MDVPRVFCCCNCGCCIEDCDSRERTDTLRRTSAPSARDDDGTETMDESLRCSRVEGDASWLKGGEMGLTIELCSLRLPFLPKMDALLPKMDALGAGDGSGMILSLSQAIDRRVISFGVFWCFRAREGKHLDSSFPPDSDAAKSAFPSSTQTKPLLPHHLLLLLFTLSLVYPPTITKQRCEARFCHVFFHHRGTCSHSSSTQRR